MTTRIKVSQRNTITIPAPLRQKYNIKPGDTWNVVDFDGFFVLTQKTPLVDELAYEIEQLRQEAGVSLEELWQGLREQREIGAT